MVIHCWCCCCGLVGLLAGWMDGWIDGGIAWPDDWKGTHTHFCVIPTAHGIIDNIYYGLTVCPSIHLSVRVVCFTFSIHKYLKHVVKVY